MSKFLSPLQKRLQRKLEEKGLHFSERTMRVIQNAFVTAVKEEVEERYDVTGPPSYEVAGSLNPNLRTPLVIAGLGSFKMRTRPAREFPNPPCRGEDKPIEGDLPLSPTLTKPPARRLIFTAKWEEIK